MTSDKKSVVVRCRQVVSVLEEEDQGEPINPGEEVYQEVQGVVRVALIEQIGVAKLETR